MRDGEVVWDTAMGTKSAITIQVLRRRITPVSEWEGGVREGMVPHRESMGTWRWETERGGGVGRRRSQEKAVKGTPAKTGHGRKRNQGVPRHVSPRGNIKLKPQAHPHSPASPRHATPHTILWFRS